MYQSKEARARKAMAEFLEMGLRTFRCTLDEITYGRTPEGHADYIRDLIIGAHFAAGKEFDEDYWTDRGTTR